MRIGVPREVKNHEYRVAATPACVHELTVLGHDVVVERGAGEGSAIGDDDYTAAGAKILDDADQVWAAADLVLKVKEPIAEEYHRLRPDLTLFTYLHLAASEPCTRALLDAGTNSIAYETVQGPDGSLPLLFPMSEVAGRLAPLVGAHCLMRPEGGRGVLIGGVTGVEPARVVVIGAGVSGMNAAAVAAGTWGDVVLFDKNIDKLRAADRMYQGRIQTLAVQPVLDRAGGARGRPGDRCGAGAGRKGTAAGLQRTGLTDEAGQRAGRHRHRPGRLFRGLATHHPCGSDVPGAQLGVLLRGQHARRRPLTSTHALTNVTMPYVVELAEKGFEGAVRDNAALRAGVSTVGGRLTCPPVGAAHGLASVPTSEAVNLR